jgi:hypothetical protein
LSMRLVQKSVFRWVSMSFAQGKSNYQAYQE